MLLKIVYVLLVLSVICGGKTHNILVVVSHPGISHFKAFENLFVGLATKGHNVTVISHFPRDKPIPNYKDVSIREDRTYSGLQTIKSSLSFDFLGINDQALLMQYGIQSCESMKHKNFQKFLKEKNHFDLVILNEFSTLCYRGLAKKYKAPYIEHPAYMPRLASPYSDRMTFFQRVDNFLSLALFYLYYRYKYESSGNEYSKKYLGVDLLEDNFLYNMSLLFTNSHFSINFPRPLVPNIIELSGMHIRKPKQLPKHLEQYISESTHGVIYFSLGSTLKGHSLPPEKRDVFLTVFRDMPERVIWKWENDTMEGKPENVLLQKWTPQFDIIFSVILAFDSCNASKILVVVSHPGVSHFKAFENLFVGLAKKGHNVTVISHFPQQTPIPNYRDVSIREEGAYSCKSMKHENFQKFLKEDSHFDLVILNEFSTLCYRGLARKYKAPYIGLAPTSLFVWHALHTGSPEHPGYMPKMGTPYTDKMTFLQRVENSLLMAVVYLKYKFLYHPNGNEFSRKYLGVDILEDNFLYSMSLLFTNMHYSLHFPRPLVPNIIETAGLHIGEPKMLPKHLQQYISESPHGVIYFSLGSTLKGHTLPKEKRDAFIEVFKDMPERIIWKWENDTMDGKPDNVLLQKWTPQFDIICHPGVKAFIFQGGMLSLPIYADQSTNAASLIAKAGGVVLQLDDVNVESVREALTEVLSSK
ncbi:unnamed protein product [Callosobruchus maculatus]|uniref:UDP-glycosyltransferases domain-containing protein n=1 Tax=Callosobruchus maculatus TaxID=64391 RepID=A0A653D551_CALMS|nr:unnamed protein product [Callosobruchus maculatus]